MGRFVVGVDVGGTFTDGVVLDVESGRFWRVKVLTCVEDPSVGVVECVRELLAQCGASPIDVLYVAHATTIGSNLLLGQCKLEIPRVLVVTTRGFRDVIRIGRQARPELYSLCFRKPRLPVDNNCIVEVRERTLADGKVLEEPSEEDLAKIIETVRKIEPSSIAVCFLNSYVNPSNELKVKQYLQERVKVPVVASSEVVKICKEYERFCTAIVNAILIPVLSRYLSRLREGLRSMGLISDVFLVASYGGLVDIDRAISLPVQIIESGPAAGAVACAEVASVMGESKVLGFDMGGTTAKFATIIGGSPILTEEYEVGGRVHMGRRIKGTGIPIAVPMIDLVEISAGGGTIISVDEAGLLKVGPLSAGADPGPACYGRGGTEPTITDAHLIIGRLGTRLLKGRFVLDSDAARRAMREKVCEITNMEVEEAALGAIRIINSYMARGMKIAVLERGLDPQDFVMVAYGGAGPLHACELADELGICKVVVPPAAGVFTALGMTLMKFVLKEEHPVYKMLDEVDVEELKTTARRLSEKLLDYARTRLSNTADVVIDVEVYMRYLNQDQELSIRLEQQDDANSLLEKYRLRYSQLYGYVLEKVPVELTRLVVTLRLKLAKLSLKVDIPRSCRKVPDDVVIEERNVFTESGWVRAKVYDRDRLVPGYEIEGPAVIEDYDTTVYVPEGWTCLTASERFLILMRQ